MDDEDLGGKEEGIPSNHYKRFSFSLFHRLMSI